MGWGPNSSSLFLARVVTFLLLVWRSLAEEGCASLAAAGDCEFYRCVDRHMGGCGREAYPMGFGYKYCRRFQESKEMFDQEGQKWVDNVRHCLMKKLLATHHLDHPSQPPSSSPPPSCRELAMAAYDSHPHCYVEGGVCTNVVTNCDNFMRVIELLEFSDLVASADVGFNVAAKQVLSVLTACPGSVISNFFLCSLKSFTDSLLVLVGGIS